MKRDRLPKIPLEIDDLQQDNLQPMQQREYLMQRGSREQYQSRPKQRDRQRPNFTSQDDPQGRPLQRGSRERQSGPMQRDHQGADSPLPIEDQQDNLQPRHQSGSHRTNQTGHSQHKPPKDRMINLAVWFGGACCALLWTLVILGGILVLIVYLVFRPRSPLLDIQSATLNAAYIDTGALLNADVTILANFSNPNRKVAVAFSYVQVDLYFMGTPVATQAVEPFAERPGESALKNLHMIASEVPLPQKAVEEWRRGTSEEGVALELEGRFRTRSDFGKWLHFTYWLYGRCTIIIGAPPSGVLLSSRCRTKR